ncbi:TonB-dependent receptor plug domain-containing protein [Sphingosinithalassobacter sp. LHW66-3]|uniref:TonB-dependent receptor plug domain-containing protein n=1 Tax=Sphingosinithalassobacter sp. LHW66-3 TaxID=3424718 RepID=UPI003D6A95AF
MNAGSAQAQDANRLPEVVAEGDRAPVPYQPGEGVETGTSTVERQQVVIGTPGSGDVNQLLKTLPTVQFTRDEGLATREEIQDLRPADISISGGRFYENLFTLDGIDVSSRMDVTQDNPFNFNEVAGAGAQGLWLDSELVGSVTLRDSNVSAEYGRFTGGVLEIESRAPAPVIRASANASYTSDALTSFKVSDRSREALGADFPERPEFEKWRYGASFDLPVMDGVTTLFAYNRSQADVTYFRGRNYGNAPFGQSSLSENFLGKLQTELGGGTSATAQLTYSPYRSEASNANGVDNLITSHGGGITGRLGVTHTGDIDWSIDATFAHTDTSREAPAFNYSIPSSTTNGNVCAATNCTIGGFGDLEQRQNNYGLKARASAPTGFGLLSAGFDYQRIDARRQRSEDGGAFQMGVTGANIVCAQGDSLACVTGEYALTRQQVYRAYDAHVELDSVAAWIEARADMGEITARIGLRYDHEGFLENHNFAPRLSVAWQTPLDGWSVTLGANRYYGRSLLAYAMRAQYPVNVTLERAAVISGGNRVYSDNWTIRSLSKSATYSGDGALETPYSDELSAGINGGLLGGTLSLRGIYREGRNEFTRAPGTTETIVLENGLTDTYTQYTLANDGFSSYRGASLEYVRSFGKHSLGLNLNWSKTRSSNDDYLVDVQDTLDGTPVLFQGEVMTIDEVEALNQREDFASPLLGNVTWTALWLDDRIQTNANFRYRHGFSRIEDTGVNETVEGVRYDVFDRVEYPDALDVNLNARIDVIRTALGKVTADVRVANLLDNTPAPNSTLTTQPYQFGRSFWVGLNWRF